MAPNKLFNLKLAFPAFGFKRNKMPAYPSAIALLLQFLLLSGSVLNCSIGNIFSDGAVRENSSPAAKPQATTQRSPTENSNTKNDTYNSTTNTDDKSKTTANQKRLMFFHLYGFKLAQPIKNVFREMKKPTETKKFKDGYVAYIYQRDHYFVIFETNPQNPEIIWSIQIAGTKNPPNRGMLSLNLGDKIKDVLPRFAKPDEQKPAVDLFTKETLKDIQYYSFHKSGNFSFETTDDLVSSIKINYHGPAKNTSPGYPLKKLKDSAKAKNYNKLIDLVSYEFAMEKKILAKGQKKPNGKMKLKKYAPRGSVLNFIQGPTALHTFLFSDSAGLSLPSMQVKYSAMRAFEDNRLGYAYTLDIAGQEIQLLFMYDFEGWVLKSIQYQ